MHEASKQRHRWLSVRWEYLVRTVVCLYPLEVPVFWSLLRSWALVVMSSFKSQQEFGAGGSSLLFLGVGDIGLNGAAVHKERAWGKRTDALDDRGILGPEVGRVCWLFCRTTYGSLQHAPSCVALVSSAAFDAVFTTLTSAFNSTARVYIPHCVSNVQVLFLTRSTYFMPCCL